MTITASNLVPSASPRTTTTRLATAALAVVSAGIVVIGARFLVQPDAAAAGFGVSTTPGDPFLAVKGVRDIGSGLVLGAVLALGGRRVAGGVGLAAAVIPLGDMVVVLIRGGAVATALGVHGATALVMVAAGAALVLGSRRGDRA